MDKARWFVKRAIDGRMLCRDGKWRDQVDPADIRFYSTCGRAMKYGLKGCPAKPHPYGNTQSLGTAFAVYEGEQVDACGHVHHGYGMKRNRVAVSSVPNV